MMVQEVESELMTFREPLPQSFPVHPYLHLSSDFFSEKESVNATSCIRPAHAPAELGPPRDQLVGYVQAASAGVRHRHRLEYAERISMLEGK